MTFDEAIQAIRKDNSLRLRNGRGYTLDILKTPTVLDMVSTDWEIIKVVHIDVDMAAAQATSKLTP